MNDKKFPYFRTFLTSMGFFTINLTWSVYSVYVPIFLRNNLEPMLGGANILFTLIGVIMVLDNIAAMILQPIIGSLSDKIWFRKLGRRMPFIILGIPLAAMFFGLIGTFESMFFWLLFAICGFNISMALYNTPVLSLIPDTVPEKQISLGNSVLNIVGGLANITGLLLSAFLYARNHQLAFWVMSIIMIVCLVILIINVREKKEIESDNHEERLNLRQSIKQIIKDKNLTLLLLLFTVFAHNSGYQMAETYFSNYAEQFLLFSADKAANIMGVFLIIQIVLSIPGGLLTKRVGAINASLLGCIGFLLGFIPISIISMTNTSILGSIITLNGLQISWEFFVYSICVLIMGFGWMLLFMNLLLSVWNLAPKGRTATYTSFYYVFWNLAAILSPLIAGGFFDLISFSTEIDGLKTLFILVSGVYVITLVLLLIIKIKQDQQFKLIDSSHEEFDDRVKDKNLPLKFLPLVLFGIGLRREEDFVKTKVEQRIEKKEIQSLIKSLRYSTLKNPIKLFAQNIEIKERRQQIKNQKQVQKDLLKEHRKDTRKLKEKLLKEKIKEQMTKANSEDKV